MPSWKGLEDGLNATLTSVVLISLPTIHPTLFCLFIFILIKIWYKKKCLGVVHVIADYWPKPVHALLPHCLCSSPLLTVAMGTMAVLQKHLGVLYLVPLVFLH